MPRRTKPKKDVRIQEVPTPMRERMRSPVGILFGKPIEVRFLLSELSLDEAMCFQMDLFPAERLRESVASKVSIVSEPDIWDIEQDFETLIYLPESQGERELKIDVLEQAFHLLRPKGQLMVWSSYRVDDFFPSQLKKIYGKISDFQFEDTTLFIAQRGDKQRTRRRHEMIVEAKIGDRPRCRFVTRPGTFSYGRLDMGSRALMETAIINPGDAVLDLGCGCGTNGIYAWQQTGNNGHITFLDSNVRATTLTEMNAKENGVENFEVVTSSKVEGFTRSKFDVILTNPPYFASDSITRMFAERSLELLAPEGRFYLVTRKPEEMIDILMETFGDFEEIQHRGYHIFQVQR